LTLNSNNRKLIFAIDNSYSQLNIRFDAGFCYAVQSLRPTPEKVIEIKKNGSISVFRV